MNEEIRPGGAPEAAQPLREPEKSPERLWTALGLAAGLAMLREWLYAGWMGRELLPGAGATLFVFAAFAAVWFILRGRMAVNVFSVGLTVFSLGLAASFSLWSYLGLRIVNSVFLLCAAPAAFFALAGLQRRDWRDGRIVPETIALCFRALFAQIPAPFRALGRLKGCSRRAVGGVLLALALCVPVLGAVLALLGSADAVFLDLERRALAALHWDDPGDALLTMLRLAALTLLLCSALCTLTLPPRPEKGAARETPALPAAPVLALLAALDAVYAVFVAVQFRCLFGGTAMAAMEGGYALYARSGFFQLTAVAAINVGAVLLAAAGGKGARPGARRALRVLALALLAFTAVILVSAVWRMALYISVYGLSILRLLTLWGIAFIAVCLGGAGYRLFRPEFRFFALFLAVGLTLWLLMSLGNPAGLVARYNVDAWLDGRIEEMDSFYLYTLGTDALPALERLRASVGAEFYGSGTDVPLEGLLSGLRRGQQALRPAELTLSALRAER